MRERADAMNTTGVRLVAILLMLGGCAPAPVVPPSPPVPQPVEPAPEPATPEPPQEVEKPKPEPPPPPPPPPKPAPKPEVKRSQLQAGIEAYDNGRHRDAAKLIRAALATDLLPAEQVEAHKYLAFIECSSNRRSQCRDQFRRALAIDPTLELTAAEAGHPVWGPIFRSLKQQKPRR
jgi:hypothetical protein